ncbi:hypothetical protein CCMA1212_007620 [Trichoderma ghanense]|uniref:Uncharacterized protein n=1 Tax=Trichoderma ghanense TaxID=65468 RepID=A0ABY2GXI4_9HYPO
MVPVVVVQAHLLEHIGEMVLLRRRLLGARLVLRVALNAAIGIKTANGAVGLGQNLASLLNQGLHLPHQLLLIELLLGRPLSSVDLVRNHLANRADLVERLLDTDSQLLSQLAVPLGLFLLLQLLFSLLGNILQQGDMSDGLALVVDHIAVFINLLSRASANVAANKLRDDVALFVDDVAVAVHLAARIGSLLPLDLLLLPALSLAQDISVAVDNVSILVDGPAKQLLGVTLDESSHNVARGRDNLAVLGNGAARQLGKGALLHAFSLAFADKLSLADDVAGLAQDRRLIDNSFRLGLGLVPSLGLTNDVSAAVQDVAVFVDVAALETLRVALNDDADLLPVVHDTTVCLDSSIGEVLKGGKLLFVTTVRVRQRLGLAKDVSGVVPDLSLVVCSLTEELLGVAFDQAADDVAVLVDEVPGLVDLASLELRKVNLLFFFQLILLFLREVLLLFERLLGIFLTGRGFVRLLEHIAGGLALFRRFLLFRWLGDFLLKLVFALVPAAGLLVLVARFGGIVALLPLVVVLALLLMLTLALSLFVTGVEGSLGENIPGRVEDITCGCDGVSDEVVAVFCLRDLSNGLAGAVQDVARVGHDASGRPRDRPYIDCWVKTLSDML